MSHPAASIKSIFSGKVNLTDTGLADVSDCNEAFQGIDQSEPSEGARKFASPKGYHSDEEFYSELSFQDRGNRLSEPPMISTSVASDNGDNYSVSSRNLRIMSMQKGELYDVHNSSTNISLASTGSDYQAPLPNDTGTCNSDISQNGGFLSESFSRPLSRNSTTSCLSTTATKDGIEGKKLHRHGPTSYFSNVIANMIQQQQNQQNQQFQNQQFQNLQLNHELQTGLNIVSDEFKNENPVETPKLPSSTLGFQALPIDDFLSVVSYTNGEPGKKLGKQLDSFSGLPPVTLKEKMMLLNPDQNTPEQ